MPDSNGRVYALVKLRIPKGTQIRAITGRIPPYDKEEFKCRAEQAKVLGIFGIKSGAELRNKVVYSNRRDRYGNHMEYRKGQDVFPDDFCRSDLICASGIHFFKARQRAVTYKF